MNRIVSKIELTCKTCSKVFKVYPSRIKFGNPKYCSSKCYVKLKENNPKWRGGKIMVGGYTYIYQPGHVNCTQDGYVAEHRLVVENDINRILNKSEVVHHINHIKTDNRIENLFLTTPTEHTRLHKAGVKQSDKHIKNRFSNRKKADTSKIKRDRLGKFAAND